MVSVNGLRFQSLIKIRSWVRGIEPPSREQASEKKKWRTCAIPRVRRGN